MVPCCRGFIRELQTLTIVTTYLKLGFQELRPVTHETRDKAALVMGL